MYSDFIFGFIIDKSKWSYVRESNDYNMYLIPVLDEGFFIILLQAPNRNMYVD